MTRDQLKKLERDLWAAADKLRANSDLKASEYSTPVLGLIFLKFADNKYRQHEDAILAEYQKLKGTRRERTLQEIAIERCGFALGPYARYDHLRDLPEKEDIAKAIRTAMASIEQSKPELLGVLPQQEYDRFTRSLLNRPIPKALLKLFSDIPLDASGDVFGQIYEYFLANFALSEGQGGGEFFTPRSVVRLMVEIIEPHGGKVFDPACGSGGMFVQSAQFIEQHRQDAAADLGVLGAIVHAPCGCSSSKPFWRSHSLSSSSGGRCSAGATRVRSRPKSRVTRTRSGGQGAAPSVSLR